MVRVRADLVRHARSVCATAEEMRELGDSLLVDGIFLAIAWLADTYDFDEDEIPEPLKEWEVRVGKRAAWKGTA